MERSTVVQDISEQITCGICLERFKTPKTVIPCLHNFCELCLQSTIEQLARPMGRRIEASVMMFSFECPSCRTLIKFSVKGEHPPWNMLRISQDAVQNEFKTNFQIENQLEVIQKNIEKGCPKHHGEVQMWFCKLCVEIICQFCVQEEHVPPEHEVTLYDGFLKEKRIKLSNHKDAVSKAIDQRKSACKEIEHQLETIHDAKMTYQIRTQTITDRIVKVYKQFGDIKDGVMKQRRVFDQQMSSMETKMVNLYQNVLQDIDDYQHNIKKLDNMLAKTDPQLLQDSTIDGIQTEKQFPDPPLIPKIEIPKAKELPLEHLQQDLNDMECIVKKLGDHLEVDLNKGQLKTESEVADREQAHPQLQDVTEDRQYSKEPKITTMEEECQESALKKSENPWKPDFKRIDKSEAMTLDLEKVESEDLYKKITSILNKLTPRNFQSLIVQALALPIANEERLMNVVDLIFEKAITDPTFSKAYANMCRVLSQIKAPSKYSEGLVQFRVVLINKCQKLFQDIQADQMGEAAFEGIKTIKKLQFLGYMHFIGELFKLKMLTEPIIHDCIFKLLRAKNDESLEGMCLLMTTVGKDLDHERAKKRMDQYFTSIKKITRNKTVSARIRFKLQDIEDLRKNNWVPRNDQHNPNITGIHQGAKQKQQQKIIERQPMMHTSRSRGMSSRNRPGPVMSDSDWQRVSVYRPQVDPSKVINLSKNRLDNNNVQLGPGGRPDAFGSWGRSESSESVGSRYAALSKHHGRDSKMFSYMAPPTMSSSSNARESRERDECSRRSSRDDRQQSERMQLLDEISRTSECNKSSRSIEKERLPSRDGGITRVRRDSDRDRDRAPERKPVMLSVSSLSDEDIETKGRATLDEYLNIRDMKEACQCIKELNSPDRLHLFVRLSVEHTLEMNTKKRLHTGELFSRLIAEKILSVEQYLKGLSEIVQFADDMAIDIPLIWHYLGELMGSMIQDKSQSIDFLKEALEPLRDIGKAGLLLAEIMKTAEQFIGADGMNELWHASGLKWDQFLPSNENVAEFVKEKKLEYTLPVPRSFKENPIVLMENSLSLYIASGAKVDEVFDWIERHIDPEKIKSREFIRALVTIVCQSTITSAPKSRQLGEPATIRSDPEVLKVRAKCLLKYIDGDVDKQLQALYAVQALNHKLVNPPGLLRIIFDVLYDEDVISEETFYAWQNSKDPGESGGKGVALKSVTTFFAWLGEAEDDPAN